MTDFKTPLEWALAYRKHGFSVIPIHHIEADHLCSCGKTVCPSPGKHPRLPSWTRYQQEIASEEQVRQWWGQWPLANVGIATGRVSGIVVVDIDPAHGGDASLLDIDTKTVTCLTGGGGEHYYYAHPGGTVGNRAGVIAGVDLRGDGGYVVAPPSNHSLGTYRWEVGWSLFEATFRALPQHYQSA